MFIFMFSFFEDILFSSNPGQIETSKDDQTLQRTDKPFGKFTVKRRNRQRLTKIEVLRERWKKIGHQCTNMVNVLVKDFSLLAGNEYDGRIEKRKNYRH